MLNYCSNKLGEELTARRENQSTLAKGSVWIILRAKNPVSKSENRNAGGSDGDLDLVDLIRFVSEEFKD
jgi:hypothetical protein